MGPRHKSIAVKMVSLHSMLIRNSTITALTQYLLLRTSTANRKGHTGEACLVIVLLISLNGQNLTHSALSTSTAIVTLLWINHRMPTVQCRAQTSFCSPLPGLKLEAERLSYSRRIVVRGPVIIARSWCGFHFHGFCSGNDEGSPHAVQTNWRSFAPKCPQAQVSFVVAAAAHPSFDVPQADSWRNRPVLAASR